MWRQYIPNHHHHLSQRLCRMRPNLSPLGQHRPFHQQLRILFRCLMFRQWSRSLLWSLTATNHLKRHLLNLLRHRLWQPLKSLKSLTSLKDYCSRHLT